MPWILNLETAMSNELLQVQDMTVAFRNALGEWIAVTEGVHFSISAGEVFALVGESGCGKSVTAMGLLGLLPRPGAKVLAGSATLSGQNLFELEPEALRQVRGRVASVIFQEPSSALNPVRRIRSQLWEALPTESKETIEPRIQDLMQRAGFSDVERVLSSFPHELSGGMLQRVMIVMALLSRPQLLIADEPTTALDVTVQAQVMMILRKLCLESGTGLLLITHNLGLVAQYADRLGVMYAGRIVETGTTQELLGNPKHPYTRGLLAAIPDGHSNVQSMQAIAGTVPRPQDFDEGCRFRFRCAFQSTPCIHKQASISISPTHEVACMLAKSGGAL